MTRACNSVGCASEPFPIELGRPQRAYSGGCRAQLSQEACLARKVEPFLSPQGRVQFSVATESIRDSSGLTTHARLLNFLYGVNNPG